jgi:phosphoribosyl-ATP pyrophosphohydrolase
VGEEGVEVALAAVEGPESVVPEAADLVYHLLVLIHRTGATWDAVEEELRKRHSDR